jgi:hypothetical protein
VNLEFEKSGDDLQMHFPLTIATVPFRIPNSANQPSVKYGNCGDFFHSCKLIVPILQSTRATTSRAACTPVRNSCWDRCTTVTRTGGTRWSCTVPSTCASTGRRCNHNSIINKTKKTKSLTCSLNSAHPP